MSHQYMHINITGPAGSGKTAAMHIIGHHLRQLGFNLACYDAPDCWANQEPQAEILYDTTNWFSDRAPQQWPVLVTVEGGGVEQLLKVSVGHQAFADAYRRVVAGGTQAPQVREDAVVVERIDDVVASLRASLDLALRYQQATHGVGVAEGDAHGGAVLLDKQ
ncbi:hypothetical protein [Stutzerimonas stutzeri]|uniref:hypothetical protein n=1 Tax=Stutzerimonas stutzeri TaxID=316 RepID=UPI00210C429B|nr:hypothetical protein [Stutzerimonas stutzeri]MCQ4321476.1 hypothetical protein [Stutzerimonas stutzeri]